MICRHMNHSTACGNQGDRKRAKIIHWGTPVCHLLWIEKWITQHIGLCNISPLFHPALYPTIMRVIIITTITTVKMEILRIRQTDPQEDSEGGWTPCTKTSFFISQNSLTTFSFLCKNPPIWDLINKYFIF